MVASVCGTLGAASADDLLVLTPAALLLPFVVEKARAALAQLEHASLLPGTT
jgi:hypothetical protein